MNGAWLGIGAVGLGALLGHVSRSVGASNQLADVEELRSLLRASALPEGSRAGELSREKEKRKRPTRAELEREEAAQKFLVMDPETIPDELLVATVLLLSLIHI